MSGSHDCRSNEHRVRCAVEIVNGAGRVGLDYAGPFRDFPTWSATDVLRGHVAPAEMKDGGDGGGDGGSGDGGDGEGEGQEDGGELAFGPFLVDLSGTDLTGGIHFQFKLDVPDGTYEEVSFRVDPVSAAAAASAPVEAQRAGLAELAGKGASVLVNGTSQGAPFELAAPISAKQENEGSVVVDANGAALTLNVDPSRWFLAADGSTVLDPSDAANAAAISANIRASIRVENEDDHHDG